MNRWDVTVQTLRSEDGDQLLLMEIKLLRLYDFDIIAETGARREAYRRTLRSAFGAGNADRSRVAAGFDFFAKAAPESIWLVEQRATRGDHWRGAGEQESVALRLCSEAEFSGDRVCALDRRPAFNLLCLTLLAANGLVPLLLLARQFFLALLVCLVSHKSYCSTPRATLRLAPRPWPGALAQDSVPRACPWGSTNSRKKIREADGAGIGHALVVDPGNAVGS